MRKVRCWLWLFGNDIPISSCSLFARKRHRGRAKASVEPRPALIHLEQVHRGRRAIRYHLENVNNSLLLNGEERGDESPHRHLKLYISSHVTRQVEAAVG